MSALLAALIAVGLGLLVPSPPDEGPGTPPITALAFAPGETELVSGSQDGLVVHTWPALEQVRRLEVGLPHVHDIAFAPDGSRFAAVGGEPGFEGVVEVRAWPTGELIERHDLADDLLYAATWSPAGDLLACAGHRGEVIVLAPGSDPRFFEGHLSPVLALAFVAEGATLVTGGADRSLRVWNVADGECLHVLSNHTGTVRGIAAAPAQPGGALPLVASIGDDRTLRLWQPTIGRLMRFARLPAEPLALAWCSDGSRLLVAGRDGSLQVIDPQTVTVTSSPPALDSWAYSLALPSHPDPRIALGGANGALRALELPVVGQDEP